MSQQLANLSKTLYLTHEERFHPKRERSLQGKILLEKMSAREKYQSLTNRSKDDQKGLVSAMKSTRKPGWRHDHYKINQTFGLFEKKEIEPFPNNNEKANVQLLDRALHGTNLKFAAEDWGYFDRPKDKLYSNHYKPIIKEKRSFNEDYELRTSLYGETWVDERHDTILDSYKLQANPFRTPASNNLISIMRKDRSKLRIL